MEMLIVVLIIAMVFAISSVNLGRPQVDASIDTTVDELVADLKSQQMLAMSGEQGSAAAQQPQGIFVQSNNYILFAGSSFSAGDANNFTVSGKQGISYATTLPSGRVIFNKGTGDVSGYANGSNTIIVSSSGSTKTISISRFGAVTVN